MITFQSVTKSFGDKLVLDHFSFSFPEKGVICLFGPSGCGKTTLLHLLIGILKPDGGEVKGLENLTFSVAFQENRLLEHLTVLQNVMLGSDKSREETAIGLLKELKLYEERDSYPSSLSGGMQRRAALARALCFSGDVLILDEPFKGLDRELKQEAMRIVSERYEDKLIFMISHDMSEAAEFADEIILVAGLPFHMTKTLHPETPARVRSEAERHSLLSAFDEDQKEETKE